MYERQEVGAVQSAEEIKRMSAHAQQTFLYALNSS